MLRSTFDCTPEATGRSGALPCSYLAYLHSKSFIFPSHRSITTPARRSARIRTRTSTASSSSGVNIEPVRQSPATTTVLEPTIDAAGVGVIDLTFADSKTSDADGRRKRRRVSLPASAADNNGDEENESLDVKRAGAKTRSTAPGVLKRKRLSLPSLPPVAPPTTDLKPVSSIEEPAALPARKRRRSSGLPTAPTASSPQNATNAKPTGKTTQSRKRTRVSADKPDQDDEQEEVENIDSVKVIAVSGKEKDKEMKKGVCPLNLFFEFAIIRSIFSPFFSSHYAVRFSFPLHQTIVYTLPIFYFTSTQSEQRDIIKCREPFSFFSAFLSLFHRLILAYDICLTTHLTHLLFSIILLLSICENSKI